MLRVMLWMNYYISLRLNRYTFEILKPIKPKMKILGLFIMLITPLFIRRHIY